MTSGRIYSVAASALSVLVFNFLYRAPLYFPGI
ncbi:MAG: hypothetical protein ACOWWO_03685 [Peptococcaceae bacterium]